MHLLSNIPGSKRKKLNLLFSRILFLVWNNLLASLLSFTEYLKKKTVIVFYLIFRNFFSGAEDMGAVIIWYKEVAD